MSETVAPRLAWFPVLGFILWCSALVIMYTAHAVGCAFGWPTAVLRTALGAALLAHLAAIGWLWRAHRRVAPGATDGRTAAFLHQVGVGASAAALITGLFTLGPALLLETCV